MKLPTPPLTAAEACHLLNVSPDRLNALRVEGLAPSLAGRARAAYSQPLVEGLRRLLAVTRDQEWPIPSLCWYADLAFASEVGRVVLLPIGEPDGPPADHQPSSWFGTPHASAVLRDLESRRAQVDEQAAALVRSLLNATLNAGQFWKDEAALRQSALWPVIQYLQAQGHAILAPDGVPIPEGGEPFALLVLAFGTLAPPLAGELRQIVQATYSRLRPAADAGVPVEEQQAILKEQLVAVDKLYASRAAEIHAPLDDYKVNAGVMVVAKRTVALQLKLPLEYTHSSLDNILDIIRPYLGVYGARVVQALYEVANDPPYWRSPIITIDTNHLLDRLGEKRDGRGIHYSRNRARLRDTLNASHNLEIVGEYTLSEGGKQVRKAFRRPVLSLIGATFDSDESAGITTEELFQKGLPKNMQVRLNFYEGVRKPDGTLGNQYILMPRLAGPTALPKANYAGTHERLRHFLLLRYRQARTPTPVLAITRAAALETAAITNKNITRATQTLEKALLRLVEEGTLVSFTPVPLRAEESFTCVLAEKGVGG